MRLLPPIAPKILERPLLFQDEDEEDRRKSNPEEEEQKSGLAFVYEVGKTDWSRGPGHEAWERAVGPVDGFHHKWLCKAAALADVVVLLSEASSLAIESAEEVKINAKKLGVPRPLIFAGTFLDDDADGVDKLAGHVDGVVVAPRPRGDAEVEAEMMRRACSTLGERLLVERGSWAYAPAVCVTGPFDVLCLIPPHVVEFSLTFDEPPQGFIPEGKMIVCKFSEARTWWAQDYSTSGPGELVCPAWARNPASPKT